MAINTQAQRMGALGFSSPIAELPFPDGTIDQDDWYVLLGLYQFDVSTGDLVEVVTLITGTNLSVRALPVTPITAKD